MEVVERDGGNHDSKVVEAGSNFPMFLLYFAKEISAITFLMGRA